MKRSPSENCDDPSQRISEKLPQNDFAPNDFAPNDFARSHFGGSKRARLATATVLGCTLPPPPPLTERPINTTLIQPPPSEPLPPPPPPPPRAVATTITLASSFTSLSPHLPLPEPLALLSSTYDALQRVFVLTSRGGKPRLSTISSLSPQIQALTHRTLYEEHIQRLLFLYPEGMRVQWRREPLRKEDGTRSFATVDNLLLDVGILRNEARNDDNEEDGGGEEKDGGRGEGDKRQPHVAIPPPPPPPPPASSHARAASSMLPTPAEMVERNAVLTNRLVSWFMEQEQVKRVMHEAKEEGRLRVAIEQDDDNKNANDASSIVLMEWPPGIDLNALAASLPLVPRAAWPPRPVSGPDGLVTTTLPMPLEQDPPPRSAPLSAEEKKKASAAALIASFSSKKKTTAPHPTLDPDDSTSLSLTSPAPPESTSLVIPPHILALSRADLLSRLPASLQQADASRSLSFSDHSLRCLVATSLIQEHFHNTTTRTCHWRRAALIHAPRLYSLVRAVFNDPGLAPTQAVPPKWLSRTALLDRLIFFYTHAKESVERGEVLVRLETLCELVPEYIKMHKDRNGKDGYLIDRAVEHDEGLKRRLEVAAEVGRGEEAEEKKIGDAM